MEEEADKKKKRKIAFIVVILVISITIPVTFISLFIKEEGSSVHYFTYKEFHDQFESLDLKDGDDVHIKDVFSGIWYNESTQYTYMTFESMDASRTDPWGYDAGYQSDITQEYHVGDKVKLKIEMEQEMNDQGIPILVGHIRSIDHVD
jgi:hypothetical protein